MQVWTRMSKPVVDRSDNGPERVGIKRHFPEHLMVEKDACVQEEALAYHPAEGDVCEAVAGTV
jgi:hypothetical protein